MTLFVNGSKRTRIDLFGKVSLLTNDIIDKLFDMEIKGTDFVIDNLKFERFTSVNMLDNKFTFVISQVK